VQTLDATDDRARGDWPARRVTRSAQPGRSAAFPWRRTLARDVRILARGTHTLILVALVAARDWAEPEGHVGTSTVRSSPWQAGAHRRARKLGCAGMHPVSGQGRRPP
jgi:hypothetical protein